MRSGRIGLDLDLIPLPRRAEIGDYDWYDIEFRGVQVGKTRCRIESDLIRVYSIMIYPEYERKGYARTVIDHFKKESDCIVADRVRYTAREFWIEMGFWQEGENDFIWRRKRP